MNHMQKAYYLLLKAKLQIPLTRDKTLIQLRKWTKGTGPEHTLAYMLQETIAKVTGGTICPHCGYAIGNCDRHYHCERQLYSR